MNQKKYRKISYLPFLLGVCALIFIILMMGILIRSNPLEGRWNMDGVTVYEFENGNKGALLLPSAEYEFTYMVKENVLCIDFVSEEAKDASYSLQINGDTLTLEGGNATSKGTYILTKVREDAP